jgi:hypothetical protein
MIIRELNIDINKQKITQKLEILGMFFWEVEGGFF